jgi:hypothetical protein
VLIQQGDIYFDELQAIVHLQVSSRLLCRALVGILARL